MKESYFTVGLAGHIDHGKTSLTKALTNVETDRLKEEKERQISIELGFAPLALTDQHLKVSIIDVPGHERFIRQMIAGVAGIDLVLIVVAADEGVMPQTTEHLNILSLLGITNAMVVITKIDTVDNEMLDLVKDDIQIAIQKTPFKNSQIFMVDSLSLKGIDGLKKNIETELKSLPERDSKGSFRLPIDQVFTVQGQGTVVRGTVYEGMVNEGDKLMILPNEQKSKARQIQVHHEEVKAAYAGQRTAINLSGVNKDVLQRGDVVVKSDHFIITDTIDVVLNLLGNIQYPIKQRMPIKVHTGTSEVMGTIVLFDRNEIKQTSVDEVLCQIRLNEAIVTRRGDRYILRRPTPVETLGGGWVIDPEGERYRFGQETIKMLKRKQEGTPEDHLIDLLKNNSWLANKELIQLSAMDPKELEILLQKMIDDEIIKTYNGHYLLTHSYNNLLDEVHDVLREYHQLNPMRPGINKSELIEKLGQHKKMLNVLVNEWVTIGQLKKLDQFIALPDFNPDYPTQWKTRMIKVEEALLKDGLQIEEWDYYPRQQNIPTELIEEMRYFFITNGRGIKLDDKLVLHERIFWQAVNQLYQQTESIFSLKDAKETWGISRKYLIPLLETLDNMKLTKRSDQNREWLKNPIKD